MTRALLRVIALLVPRASRPRWREEWLAETGEIARVRGRLARLRAVTGAIPDAMAVRRLATDSALDLTYLAGSFLLLGTAMLTASAVPAYRASRVDPITVLRQE